MEDETLNFNTTTMVSLRTVEEVMTLRPMIFGMTDVEDHDDQESDIHLMVNFLKYASLIAANSDIGVDQISGVVTELLKASNHLLGDLEKLRDESSEEESDD